MNHANQNILCVKFQWLRVKINIVVNQCLLELETHLLAENEREKIWIVKGKIPYKLLPWLYI